jgi:hypothetical protein
MLGKSALCIALLTAQIEGSEMKKAICSLILEIPTMRLLNCRHQSDNQITIEALIDLKNDIEMCTRKHIDLLQYFMSLNMEIKHEEEIKQLLMKIETTEAITRVHTIRGQMIYDFNRLELDTAFVYGICAIIGGRLFDEMLMPEMKKYGHCLIMSGKSRLHEYVTGD